ncbi:sensor histidine kinase [Nigerium massiliense]|uniref:sensor histidine kinase n=1 Tax=Nigerium massiliense TaxID=1522317 RepID=UPI000693600E|nr:sensor histidine kinase [Nigerium massiliense]
MSTSDVWFPPGATARDWALDVALAGVLSLLGWVFSSAVGTPSGLSTFAGTIVTLLTAAPLVLRRHSPLLAMIGCALGLLLQLAVFFVPNATVVCVPIVAHAVARWVPGLPARSVVAVGLAGAVLGPASWALRGGPSPQTLFFFLTAFALCAAGVVTPYIAGRRQRSVAQEREDRLRAAEERFLLQAHEHEQQARLDEAAQRASIARELHDIVAHSLSVMIVQAEGGKALARKRPEAAEEALTTVAEIGRESLHEMRRIVGVLRGSPQPRDAEFAPAPGLADIPDLVARTSERAHLEVYGTPEGTTPALELTVYRIVQEGLTNVLKHAGREAEAAVILTHAPGQLTVEVVDNGHGVPDPTEGGGNGIRGMHERVTAMGGTIRAGVRTDGPGFRVYVVLPTDPSPTTPGGPR